MAAWAVPVATSALSALASLFGASKSSSAQNEATAAAKPYYDALASLTQAQQKRITASDPVYRALVNMAYQRMPIQSRAGTIAPSTISANSANYLTGRTNRTNESRGTATSRY